MECIIEGDSRAFAVYTAEKSALGWGEVRYGKANPIAAHINKTIERFDGAGRIEVGHLRSEVVYGYYVSHIVCHCALFDIKLVSKELAVDQDV